METVGGEAAYPLVSVVIPVYNCEAYLEACLRSVAAQEYPALEIVVVNDGSTDHSPAVIERFAASEPRVCCIDQPNAGTNLARKTGLDAATGKYVQFLDGDDALLPGAIQRLVERAESTLADIVSAPFVWRFPDGKTEISPILTDDELPGRAYFRRIFDWQGATWNMWGNFQRRTLTYDYGIDILSDVPYGQDATWMIPIFMHDPKVVRLDTPTVNYNQNPLSVTHNPHAAAKRWRGTRALHDWFENYLRQENRMEEFARELAIMRLTLLSTALRTDHLERIGQDLKSAAESVDRFPELSARLSSGELRLVRAFSRWPVLGYARLLKYRIRNRKRR